jgi:outer membrane protein assembly factor BamB
MMPGPRRATLIGIVLAASAITSCSSGAPSSPGTSPGAAITSQGDPSPGATASPEGTSQATGAPGGYPAAAWPTYNRTLARSGVATGVSPVSPLHTAWQARLDGAVYGQPLLVGKLVIAATENDSVYALDSASGSVVWHATLGTPVPLSSLPCGNVDPLGITGTPAYDQQNGLVYAVAESTGYRHTLFGLSVSSGAVKVERYIPTPDGNDRDDQQRPALAIADGRVYVEFGGLYGDCGQYQGSVVGIPLSGAGSLIHYLVPTTREGAIWGTAGPVFGPDGNFYASVGNGAQENPAQPFDGTDSVNEITPGLQRVGIFAPSTWAADNASDKDLGSTQPALMADGSILIVGKSGTGYLLQAGHLGGVGSELAQASVCPAYGGAAISGNVVYEPCRFASGVTAVQVDAANKRITVLWHGPSGAHGSPVVGGGAVWVTDYGTGTLYALDPATGQVLQQLSLGTRLPPFSSMSLAGSSAYLGTVAGVIAVSGA